jgi:GNAT superfamily N-acetyltransferase
MAGLMPLEAPQPLTDQHRRTGFDCGDSSLNHWLEQRALANQRSGATRTFVVCDGDGVVKAYVALASGAVAVSASPGRFRRNMPDPIPVVVLARLAVCRSAQGQGLARAVLADAFERVLQASEQIGVRGILVHAVSAAARAFYLHMGFDPSPTDSDTLLLRLVDVEAALRR